MWRGQSVLHPFGIFLFPDMDSRASRCSHCSSNLRVTWIASIQGNAMISSMESSYYQKAQIVFLQWTCIKNSSWMLFFLSYFSLNINYKNWASHFESFILSSNQMLVNSSTKWTNKLNGKTQCFLELTSAILKKFQSKKRLPYKLWNADRYLEACA